MSSDSGHRSDRLDLTGSPIGGGEQRRILAGRYRLEERLGKGGSGEVYRATQLDLGREVAVKIILLSEMASPSGLKRFQREAKLAQRLEHPNTVRLYDHGQTEQGLPFIVYQLLRGRSLSKVLVAEGALPPTLVVRIASQVLKSLMEAHRHDIVHRDIKPENIFLVDFHGEPDFVKILDFGIAKPTGSESQDLAATEPDEIIGTPNYMAPEQIEGDRVGPGTDLYALGLVMVEMLTGEVVFADRNPVKVLTAHLSDSPVPLTEAIEGSPLGPVIRRATAKAIGDRFADAGEMLAALKEAARALGSAASAPPLLSSDPTVASPERGHGNLKVSAAIGLGILIVVVMGAVLGARWLCSSWDRRTGITPESSRHSGWTAGPAQGPDSPQARSATTRDESRRGSISDGGTDQRVSSNEGEARVPPNVSASPEKVAAITVEIMAERIKAAGWAFVREEIDPSPLISKHIKFEVSQSHYKGTAVIAQYRIEKNAREVAAYHNQGEIAAVAGGRQYLGVNIYDEETKLPTQDKAVELLEAIVR